jgi:hypothetical protein
MVDAGLQGACPSTEYGSKRRILSIFPIHGREQQMCFKKIITPQKAAFPPIDAKGRTNPASTQ